MKRFTEFITESGRTWSTSDFQVIIANSHQLEGQEGNAGTNLRDKYLPKMIEYLNTYRSGDIPNPVFQSSIKSVASMVVEIATKEPAHLMGLIRIANNSSNPAERWNYYDYNVGQMNHVAGKLRKAESAIRSEKNVMGKAFLTWFIPVCKELMPLVTAVEEMKSRVVKRAIPTPEQKAAKKQAFIAPFAASASGIAVRAVLKKLTDGMIDEYVRDVTQYLQETAEHYANLSAEDQKGYRDAAGQFGGGGAQVLRFPIWNKVDEKFSYRPSSKVRPQDTLKTNWKRDTSIEKFAKQAAKDMQEAFMYKTSKKLVAIMEAKNIALMGEPTIVSATARRGIFEGDIRINFQDGSNFIIRNKVVLKRNSYGTVFNQFPTTFHSVVLPDGSKMGSPSEEQMNSTFVRAKPKY